MKMPGAHNVLNCLATIAVADELEVPLDVTKQASPRSAASRGASPSSAKSRGSRSSTTTAIIQRKSAPRSKRWGPLMRAGNDKSLFARQVERYADVYTSRVELSGADPVCLPACVAGLAAARRLTPRLPHIPTPRNTAEGRYRLRDSKIRVAGHHRLTHTPSLAESMYRAPLEGALSHAVDYLDALDTAPVGATATLEELRARLARPLVQDGLDAAQVIDELVKDSAGGILGSAGGRFFGWVIGGSVPAALAADWLTSTWDQNAALHACGPAEAVIEEVCGEWLKDLLGLPKTASLGLVTGCQMAHFTCLAAARNALLARRGWKWWSARGLLERRKFRFSTGSHRHGTSERALRFLGLGSDCITDLPLDGEGRLREDALAAALGQPVICQRLCSFKLETSTSARSIGSIRLSLLLTRTAHGCTLTAPSVSGLPPALRAVIWLQEQPALIRGPRMGTSVQCPL